MASPLVRRSAYAISARIADPRPSALPRAPSAAEPNAKPASPPCSSSHWTRSHETARHPTPRDAPWSNDKANMVDVVPRRCRTGSPPSMRWWRWRVQGDRGLQEIMRCRSDLPRRGHVGNPKQHMTGPEVRMFASAKPILYACPHRPPLAPVDAGGAGGRVPPFHCFCRRSRQIQGNDAWPSCRRSCDLRVGYWSRCPSWPESCTPRCCGSPPPARHRQRVEGHGEPLHFPSTSLQRGRGSCTDAGEGFNALRRFHFCPALAACLPC